MNLIDEFAMAALQGFTANPESHKQEWSPSEVAEYAYAQAEAMMVERSKRRFNTTPQIVETPPPRKITP